MTPLFTRAWRPTAGTFFVNGAAFGVWATQIPLLQERHGLDPAVLGLVLLVLGGGAVLAMATSGYLIRRFGTAAVLRASGAILLAALPVASVAPGVVTLCAVLVVLGAGAGCMDVSMNAQAAEVERRIGRPCMSSFHGLWSVGGLAGAGVGGLALALLSGPAQALLAAIVLGAILFLSQRRLLPHVVPAEGTAHASLRPGRFALMIGALMALTFAAEGAVLDWSSVYMRSELGAASQTAGIGFAAYSAAMAAGRLVGDWIRSHVGAAAIVRAGAALASGGLLLGPLTGTPWLAVLGFGIAGLGLSNLVPVLFSAAGSARDPDVAIATGATLGYGGLLAAPPLLGLFAHATSLAATFSAVAAMCLVVAVGASLAGRADRS